MYTIIIGCLIKNFCASSDSMKIGFYYQIYFPTIMQTMSTFWLKLSYWTNKFHKDEIELEKIQDRWQKMTINNGHKFISVL